MIGIIGAGISGLSLAYYLQKAGVRYKLLEAAPVAGGNIRSMQEGGYLLEAGPNSLLLGEEHLQLVKELGLADELILAKPLNKNRYIYKGSGYQKLPASPPALLSSKFLSSAAKWAIVREFFRRNQPVSSPETVAAFFERRFCKEIVDYVLNPFVGGIYAGNPATLLMEKTFPTLAEAEKQHGSVLKGMVKARKGAGRRLTYSFRHGLQTFTDALSAKVSVSTNTPVVRVERQKTGGYLLHTAASESISVSGVVLCLPAKVAGNLLATLSEEMSKAVAAINYAPIAVVHSAFRSEAVAHALDGFGGLNPAAERQFALGSVWSSSVFEGRAPEGQVLLTSFVGGMIVPERTFLPEHELKAKLTDELQRVYGIAEAPVFQKITRWEHAIPHFDAQILPAHALLPSMEQQGIWVGANWAGGASVPDCIERGKKLAQKLSAMV